MAQNVLSPYWAPNYGSIAVLNRSYAGVGHALLNARYYRSDQGQFMSEDPVFLEIGNPNEIRQLTQQKQAQLLMDPQVLNSYSYARGNPLRFKDPEGRWYVQIGTDLAWGPFSGGYGVRFNNQGVVGFYSAGAGVGLMANAPIEFNSGSIDVFKPSLTVSREGAFAGGPSITGSYESKFNPDSSLQVINGQWNFGVSAGIGGKISQTYTQTIPIYSFSSANTVQSRAQAVQNYNTNNGGSTPQNQLWVTPSGAVVTWGGGLVAGPTAQSTPATAKR